MWYTTIGYSIVLCKGGGAEIWLDLGRGQEEEVVVVVAVSQDSGGVSLSADFLTNVVVEIEPAVVLHEWKPKISRDFVSISWMHGVCFRVSKIVADPNNLLKQSR